MHITRIFRICLKQPDMVVRFVLDRRYRLVNIGLRALLKIGRSPKVMSRLVVSVMPERVKIALGKSSVCTFLAGKLGYYHGSGNRRYLPVAVSVEEFFMQLKTREVEYVILRWWEDLPQVAKGEDIDLLITDRFTDVIRDLTTSVKKGQAIDIYTVNGTNGGDYHGLPYFPLRMARRMVEERELYRDLYMVCSTKWHFRALAYHAMFHKGAGSFLPGFVSTEGFERDHDYQGEIERLLHDCGIVRAPTIENLSLILQEADCYPDHDQVSKLIDLNPSVWDVGFDHGMDWRGGELGLFVLREKALALGLRKEIENLMVEQYKLDILLSTHLGPEQTSLFRDTMRGANWGKGPYFRSGGNPAWCIVVYDYHPRPVESGAGPNLKWVTNDNLVRCKAAIRALVNDRLLLFSGFNPVHSCDNERESWDYLRDFLAEKSFRELVGRVDAIREQYLTRFPVRAVLSEGRRSKVEKVFFEGRIAIKKTFRPWASRFFLRERYVYRQVGRQKEFVPRLLGLGKNFLLVENHDMVGAQELRRELRENPDVHKNIREIIEFFFEQGLAYINFCPGNLLLTERGRLFAIDYEFLFRYERVPKAFKEAYEIVGVPERFAGDLPFGNYALFSSFSDVWSPVLGVSEDEFLSMGLEGDK